MLTEAPDRPLFCAAAKGCLRMMKLILLNKTVNINVKDETGVNAFWLACKYGHGQLMKYLAEQGIDVLVTNEQSVNALHLAVSKNYINIVKLLINSDFPIDLETLDGMTAL